MSTQFEKLEKCYEYYRSVTDFTPRVGTDPRIRTREDMPEI